MSMNSSLLPISLLLKMSSDILARLPYIDQDSQEWLQLTKGANSLFKVTASTAADIVGVGPTSRFRRWQLESGLAKEEPSERLQELWALGKNDEPYTVDRFVAYMGAEDMWVDKCGTWAHPKYRWLGASPDRRLYFPATKEIALLEVKSRQGDSIPELPNDGYYIQVQVQLACVPEATGAWFFSNNRNIEEPPVACFVTRDTEFFDSVILPALQSHIERVASGQAPPERHTQKPYAAIRASKASHIFVPQHGHTSSS